MKKCVITPDFEKKETAPAVRASYNSIKKQKKVLCCLSYSTTSAIQNIIADVKSNSFSSISTVFLFLF